ncbi:hypothetical protein LTR27_002133 [Elasticomyces elasticus]|nr:hypothetical protein LTR27_002133 [Elasticomyces elasticus]
MLDPLSALSLAAAVVQFIDFTGTLISNAHEMYIASTGSSKANLDIEQLVLTLQGLTEGLAPGSANTLAGLPPNEQKLHAIAATCRKLSEEVLVFLQKLKVPSQGRFQALLAVRQAFRATFKADEMAAIMKTLDRTQFDLNTALLLVVRDENSTVMSHLKSLSLRADALSVVLARQLDDTRVGLLTALEHQKVDISGISTKLDRGHLALLKTCADSQDSFRLLSSKLNDIVTSGDTTDRCTRLLASLRFDGIFDRQFNIASIHENTGDWMFNSDMPFTEWCKNGSGLFWIRGKAGSGKSTLMRYLATDDRTIQLLQRDLAVKPVVVASHYFWGAGSELQRSQTGLLQSLLFQVLRSCPHLISVVCPQRWASPGRLLDFDQPWAHGELQQALYGVASSAELDTEFCFLIDGLDEYAGDHQELINDLNKMAASSAIRLCVSSRPWNAFQDAYGADSANHIILEDHTHADIEHYVRSTLMKDLRFVDLVRRDGSAGELITEICERSQGVFFWVYLVVRSLLRGLTEHDDLEVLQRRLREVPSELEKLFEQILDTVDGVYKKHQAQTLLLVMHSITPLQILAIWHLQKEIMAPGITLSRDLAPLSLLQMLEVQAEAKPRLKPGVEIFWRCERAFPATHGGRKSRHMGIHKGMTRWLIWPSITYLSAL